MGGANQPLDKFIFYSIEKCFFLDFVGWGVNPESFRLYSKTSFLVQIKFITED